MADNGIIGNAQPNFLYTLENRYVETLEGEALGAQQSGRGAGEEGRVHHLRLGHPAGRSARRVCYSAVTRKGRSGTRVYGPEEAVSVQDAIRMYTLNTAYMSHDDHKKGSLEVGKFADMIVLDRDPLTIPPEQLLTMQVDMTFIGGKQVYTARKRRRTDPKHASFPEAPLRAGEAAQRGFFLRSWR